MVSCAIVGCGKIAGNYDQPLSPEVRTHAKAYQEHPDCELISVCDESMERARVFSETWCVDRVFASLEELLEYRVPDLLSICTPTVTHEELCMIACRAGVKFIWLEKPAGVSVKSTERIRDVASSYSATVWVNYFRRYSPGFQTMKRDVAKIAPLRSVRAIYTKGLRNNGSHMLDLMRFLFGEMNIISVSEILPDDAYPTLNCVASIPTLNVDLIGLDYKDYEIFELDIIGASGRVIMRNGGREIQVFSASESSAYSGYKNLECVAAYPGYSSAFMLDGLSRALRGASMPSLEDDIEVQKLIEDLSSMANYHF